jgi:formylglycine-generating enzyme required for sulfatase activity
MRRPSQHPWVWLLLLAGAALPAAARDERRPDDRPTTFPETYTERIPGSKVRFTMVGVPAGTFLMGSPKGEKGRRDDEGPQRTVTVRAYWIGRCEVTWDEYNLFYKGQPGNRSEQRAAEREGKRDRVDALSRPTPPYIDPTFGFGEEGYPAVGMSHHAAMTYCRWLSQKTGRTYRLPNEAEWEYACRAGTHTTYFFGDEPDKLDQYAWYAGNSDEATHPVGRKKANRWGLHDMLGNAAEWCLDRYDAKAYGPAGSWAEELARWPVLLPTADRFPNVVRGGSWDDKEPRLRSAARLASTPDWNKIDPEKPRSIWWLAQGDVVGFRVVRPVEEQDDLKGLRPRVSWESK